MEKINKPEKKNHVALNSGLWEEYETLNDSGYNQAIDDCFAWHKQEMTKLLLIARDCLTWCHERDKHFIYKDKLDQIEKSLQRY